MPAVTPNDLMTFLRTRRSYRRFTRDAVPAAVLTDALEAARIVSCSANGQTMKYIVVQSPAMVAAVQPLVHWAAYLPKEQGTPGPEEQPTAFIALVQDEHLKPIDDTNAGLALGSLTAMAWAHGVGSCIMGAIDRPALCRLLGVPEGMRLHTMVALGYPAHQSTTVPMEGGSVKYALDENRDYVVPKRALEEIVLATL